MTAHPNSHGFTHQIARRFIEVSEEKGHETFLMNLYDPERKQDYLMLDDHGKQMGDDKREAIHAKITRADELVFVFPLRWFDAPAIMKNWFDVNVSTGFAYRFKKDSLLPHRYLKGKSARIIFTA
ncbi:NAD(P)H-dependent oxidoreductase [Patescibacteria group bacterium]|nr:NAD(P)H-dependent oxidoreductase [Patescibacteria group bacterium]